MPQCEYDNTFKYIDNIHKKFYSNLLMNLIQFRSDNLWRVEDKVFLIN